MPVCFECAKTFHGNCRYCPNCGADNLPKKVKALELDLKATRDDLSKTRNTAEKALSLARKAMEEATAHRKQIGISAGFVTAVLGGFGVLYQHTGNDYVLLAMWLCGVLLLVFLVAFILSFRSRQREEDFD